MDCHNCKNLVELKTKDVNFPGGEITRYECGVRYNMNILKYFPFNNKKECKQESPPLKDLNFF